MIQSRIQHILEHIIEDKKRKCKGASSNNGDRASVVYIVEY